MAGAMLLVQALTWQPAAAQTTTKRIDSTADARYHDVRFGHETAVQSNTVVATALYAPATILFYVDSSFRARAWDQAVGMPLYVQIAASGCNRDPQVAESIPFTLHSQKANWTVTYTARETAPDSGVFRVAQGIVTQQVAAEQGRATGWQGVMHGDRVDASFGGCGGGTIETQVQIDPDGQVFDSSTGAAVAGATVQLIDVTGAGNGGAAGAAATVFGYDGVTPAPSQVVTGADGRYTFPKVAPSRYRLNVTPPAVYSFPSTLPATQFQAPLLVTAPGSYGGTFAVDASTGAVTLDVPVDAAPHGLSVQKIASRTSAEIAETVEYLVTVKNVGEADLGPVTVDDTLPAGFAYVPGSARLDGAALADPAGGRGPALGFAIGPLTHATARLLRYRVRLGAGALHSDGVNRAQARAELPFPTLSNVAAAKVKVEAGVFSDKSIVLGSVFADCNANGVQDAGEPGAAGVRLYLEDGSFVVTDGMGRYSFYGVSPRTHVLKVDATSLPAGAVMAAISQRHGGDGNSRFVDAHRGDLMRADFAIAGCAAPVMQALLDRQAAMGERELSTSLRTELKATPTLLGDVRALPAQGLIGELRGDPRGDVRSDVRGGLGGLPERPLDRASIGRIGVADGSSIGGAPKSANAAEAAASATSAASAAPKDSLSNAGAGLDNQLGFIALQDGQTVANRPLTVRVKGRQGATIALQVNGVAVGDRQIGERAVAEEAQTELREYVGVALQRGDNVLTLNESDAFGIARGSRSLHVVVPGPLAKITVTPERSEADADGQGRVAVRVALVDARGLPVVDRTPVTIETSYGQWDAIDLDSRTPGTQIFVEGGSASFGLMSPPAPGDAELTASTAAQNGQAGEAPVTGQARVAFVPPLRPMLAVGIVEGALNLRKLDPRSLQAAGADDGFEQELNQFAGGQDGAGARAAMFLKGKVRGDYLLTLGYDSDKPQTEGLFRDIQPDAFYPVYGDSSVRGFDAQSTGKLYVRIEHDKSYLLYGDYTTQSQNPVRQLGAYQRSLNGVKEHYENERVVANGFASHDSTRQVADELRANGTSGPYNVGGADIVANSEKVELLVRDRNQPSVVLKSTPLARFSDYDFEALSGRLLFRAPVASLDADLNPVSIRVTYEVDQGGPAFWVAGADAQIKVSDRIELGGSFVRDLNPLEPFQLSSVNGTVKIFEATQLSGEAARVDRDVTGTGGAQRVELQHAGAALKARVFAARSDVGFDNPSATLNSGRSEGGAKASYAIDERTRLTGEALHTGDITSASRRDGALVGIERSFDGGTKIELGARRVHDVPAAADQPTTDTTSLRTKLTTTVPGLPIATVFAEAEQDVRDHDKRLLALGGEYQIANQGRLYARHELISSLSGPYQLDGTQRRNTTVVGIDADYMKDGRLFSEYRGANAFDGRGTEAAIGLRNRWQLAEGLRLNTSFERVQTLSGASLDPSAAVTGAIEYTADPLWKGTARLEVRDSASTRGLLSTLGVARKLDADWTFLGKNIYALTQNKATDSTSASTSASQAAQAATQVQERLQLGVAYRDSRTNRINALGRYEFKQERGLVGDEGERAAHIVSTHADYQPNRRMTLSGHLAAKWVLESPGGEKTRSAAQLASVRATYDVGSDWDVGVATSVLAAGGLQSRKTAVGAEVGYMVQKNLWLSGGYNVTGFKDRDLSDQNYTDRGAYVRLRFKFDETLFARSPT